MNQNLNTFFVSYQTFNILRIIIHNDRFKINGKLFIINYYDSKIKVTIKYLFKHFII